MMPGSLRASIVLPVPGGPTMSTLWPPAAAISSARLASSCPRTSPKSGPRGSAGGTSRMRGGGSGRQRPRASSTSRRRSGTARTSMPSTRAASEAFSTGTISRSKPARRAPAAMATAPRTGRRAPLSDSSPTAAQRSSSAPASCPLADRSATASARSKLGPALRRSAGARLAVSRCWGNWRPEFSVAARTRSRASRTAASGRPTTVKPGSPWRTSTSTVTSWLSTPSIANVAVLASMPRT